MQTMIYKSSLDTLGAMFVPIILGSDKMTVSVGTGHIEYWPLYASIGNVHNNVRQAHHNAVALIGFFAIPKSMSPLSRFDHNTDVVPTSADKEHSNTDEFWNFGRQLFHSTLSRILASLKPGMTKPEILRYGDGHYRHTVYSIGPYIADYPEQVVLTCVIQGWCPKYVHSFTAA
jgi:hypothetical protein